jgi:hypothetical protein
MATTRSAARPSRGLDRSHMIIWGDDFGQNTGGKYDPAVDTWSPTSMVNAPAGRAKFSMCGPGTRMIIWGGDDAEAIPTSIRAPLRSIQ